MRELGSFVPLPQTAHKPKMHFWELSKPNWERKEAAQQLIKG
jgi:hypothetical protein